MRLPVMPPVKPMLARSADRIPPNMHYEAKWDGFRAIVFRDGDDIEISSRNTKSLNRYFPELVDGFRRELPARCVVDGEIVIALGDHLEFDRLLDRIHPAESRVHLLAEQTPASFVAFDLLALGDDSLLDRPLAYRREALEQALSAVRHPVHVAPTTTDRAVAEQWFAHFEGAGLDGVVAKGLDTPYRPGERTMIKIKHERTADCVVAGYRWHKSGPVIGSLLLGLYDGRGRLQHVGVCAAFDTTRRRELVDTLEPYVLDDPMRHPWARWADAQAQEADRMPGAVNRWTGDRNLDWVPLRPEPVCEVAYDHTQSDRFRHTARFRRWRPDRDPHSCTYEQLEQPVRYDLVEVLGHR